MDANISGIQSGGNTGGASPTFNDDSNTAMAVIGQTGGGSVTYDILNNTSLGTGSVAIKVTHASAAAPSTGTINGRQHHPGCDPPDERHGCRSDFGGTSSAQPDITNSNPDLEQHHHGNYQRRHSCPGRMGSRPDQGQDQQQRLLTGTAPGARFSTSCIRRQWWWAREYNPPQHAQQHGESGGAIRHRAPPHGQRRCRLNGSTSRI